MGGPRRRASSGVAWPRPASDHDLYTVEVNALSDPCAGLASDVPPVRRPPLMMRTGHEELRVAGHQMPSLDATAWPPISRIVAGSPTTTSRSVARDIPTYSRSRERSRTFGLVDAQHDGAPFETLAAEHVAVEDVVVVPAGLPVLLLRVERRALELHRVAVAGGEQRDVLGPQPSSSSASTSSSAASMASSAEDGDEAHVRTVTSARVHPGRRERTERLVDLLGVPQVVVEHERDERHRRLAEAREDPLVLVGVDVEPARSPRRAAP